jgi:hypothetical protein
MASVAVVTAAARAEEALGPMDVQQLVFSITRCGFREYYDPFTGEGHGAREFTWSGLLVDMAD